MLFRLPSLLSVAGMIALAGLGAGAGVTTAHADSKLEARYSVSLLGVPLGKGSWVVDVGEDRYTMAVTAQVTGLMKAFSSGDGAAGVQGAIQNGHVAPSAYAIHIKSRNKTDEVRMGFAGGGVKQLVIEPPFEPKHDTVPLTEAHKRGVVDPISMGLIPAVGPNGLSPQACDRKVAAFDGRIRFDLALSYKRMDSVKAEQGYAGPALVCGARFIPIAGYETGRAALKALRESRDIEIWYAPVAGTKFIAMYRINVPTMLGPAVLQATRFESVVKAARTGAGTPKTQ